MCVCVCGFIVAPSSQVRHVGIIFGGNIKDFVPKKFHENPSIISKLKEGDIQRTEILMEERGGEKTSMIEH